MEVQSESADKSLWQELAKTFRSFRHRNYRLYFGGQLVSLSGTWMQSLAQSWLVYSMTQSAWMLGVVNCATHLPILLFGLLGGSIADRYDRRKIILCMQFLEMFQASCLAYLTLSGRIEVWHICLLAFVFGIANAFETPARQALVVNMVDRKDLVNATSLNATFFHASRAIGPAIAGILVGWVGEGPCFLVNAVSYMAALVAIYLIKMPKVDFTQSLGSKTDHVLEALKYAWSTPLIRKVLLLAGASSLFGMQFMVMMPVVAAQVLHKHAGVLGALLSGAGIGACLAALFLANRAHGEMLKRGIGYASLGFAITLICFSFSTNLYLSIALAVMLGFFMTSQLSGSHSLLQLSIGDELRGRLSSIWMITILGIQPVGSLLLGWAANYWGAPHTLLGCACICAVSALTYLTRK